jgi:hypothetical protein
MSYYMVRIEVWCDWDGVASELEEIVEDIRTGDAICTKRQVVDLVDRPQDIEDEDAMSFFGGDEGDADLSQARSKCGKAAYQVEPLREDRSYIGPQHPGAAVRPAEGRLGVRISGTDHRPSVCAKDAFQSVLDSMFFGIDMNP